MRRNPKALKAAKQARMRSAYLKPYDISAYIKVKGRAGKDGIPDDQLGYFNYRQRGNTFWDPYLEAKFPSRGMVSEVRLSALNKKQELEREKVLRTLAEWSQLILEEMNVIVHRGGITKTVTRLFFNSDYTLVFFTKEDYASMRILKSVEYRGSGARERAYFALNHNSIDWIESTDLSSLNEQSDS